MEMSIKVEPIWTIHELLMSHPETAPVLRTFAIDSCCGGSRSISAAAKSVAVDPQVLLRALEAAIAHRTAAPQRQV
jgi:iron-sulfur cluster repair protein YtfE (RIC family)